MAFNWMHYMALFSFVLFIQSSSQATARANVINDIYGNLLSNNDDTFPTSDCCVVPTCIRPGECYQTQTCGPLCSSGKYPPAELSYTPGYRLKYSYSRFECRFEECKYYEFTCKHCPDPRANYFSINVVREDCKECYYLG